MLDLQINILSVDTGNFYSNKEAYLHWLNHKLRVERNKLISTEKELYSKLHKFGFTESKLKHLVKETNEGNDIDLSVYDDNENYLEIFNLLSEYITLSNYISFKNKKIKDTKSRLLLLLSNKTKDNIDTNGNHHIRQLRNINASSKEKCDVYKKLDIPLEDSNMISVFDSFFTRTIGAKPNEFSDDFMVVQVYYFDIIKDLIHNGFEYNGEKYIYFTSSAGQIRTKKTVFVKESTWNKYKNTITCGLTLDRINEKGGCNSNKYLAYTALANSATDEWKEFNIDKCIVVDDFEADVFGTVDFIDDKDYTITRKDMNVPVPHMDGCGIMLPSLGSNRMVRLPWVKGLLGSFDFVKFIDVNNCSPIVKDIYGVEHNVVEENIEIIFTKSQFKMYKYYESWEEYKELFKKYNCTAGYTNMELERIKNATINYQMLQSLTDITDDEIEQIVKPSVERLNNICNSVDTIKNIYGATAYNVHKTPFQKAITLYPELLNDRGVKDSIRDIKDSLIKKYKSGKLNINGKYTFVLPDLYAFCEWLFMDIKEPKGLLNGDEVFCWLFRKINKVDCLRSPHLYKEHAIRNNVACNGNERQEQIREWFTTNAIYTSTQDLISKILQFDVDGDTLLVLTDKTIIDVAERNIKDVVPLYYDMLKAPAVELNNTSIYDGLNSAFTHGNIGIYSNNISKIWNSDTFVNGSEDEKKLATDIVKLLCMENNFCIDSAKTLYMPERPEWFSEELKKYTNNNLPHFFKYAKDKEIHQVEKRNDSFVNKFDTFIPNIRLNFRKLKLGKPDYKLLMDNENIECIYDFDNCGKLIRENTDQLILKYLEISNVYRYKINSINDFKRSDISNHAELKNKLMYEKVYKESKLEFSKFGYTDNEIVDILIKFLYGANDSVHKNLLWVCYGDIIYDNMTKKIKPKLKDKQCSVCGEWYEVKIKDNTNKMCPNCYYEYRKEYYRERKRKQRDA